jgi:hypothetical protein
VKLVFEEYKIRVKRGKNVGANFVKIDIERIYLNKFYATYMGFVEISTAQAVSRWLPTAAARVRVRAACGVCGGQRGNGAGFLRVLRFPLPIIPPISP